MPEANKLIFGKKYNFKSHPNYAHLLLESLQAYTDFNSELADVFVYIDEEFTFEETLLSNNPKIYFRYESSFTTDFGNIKVTWKISKDKQLSIYMSFPKKFLNRNTLNEWAFKLISIEFGTKLEIFEQILHELVLVPSTYFLKNLVPIHASAVAFNGNAVLFAGTGGTGKTSTILSLRDNERVSFLSDDITIIGENGYIFPNLAWPKIYGYNLKDDKKLKSLIFRDRNIIDKMHFNLRNKISPDRVRRKIRPEILYSSLALEGAKLRTVFYLFRHNVSSLSIEKIEIDRAVDISIKIMETEYATFHRFLEWEKINFWSNKNISKILIDLNTVKKNWKKSLHSYFKNISLELVSIPITMSNNDFLVEFEKISLSKSGYY